MKKNNFVNIIAISVLVGFVFIPSFTAKAQSTTSSQALILMLQEQIVKLQAQIAAINAQLEAVKKTQSEVKDTAKDIKGTLKLIGQLKPGMTSDDVKLLQEILATDPEVYPEGKITGFFGPLTERAVKKFQKKAGIDQVGVVGPKTMSKINEILEEGAGNSGKVPPGLLIAPGILKKLGYSPQPLPGQVLPPGIAKKIGTATTTPPAPTTTPDVMAPVISGLAATSTIATSTGIIWTTNESADSRVWYGVLTPVISASSTLISSSDLVLNHSLTIPGLTASTTYYYLAVSADAAGNTATSSENSFITLP